MSKISVIVPVYGVELYIESCLRSIAAQTFSDFELILVDDGCLDRSVELAEAYLRTTALNWRVLHQENAGQGPARDHGIREARGEYVVCIDSDDTVAPCFLQALYEAAFETQSAVVFSGYRMCVPGEDVPAETAHEECAILSRQEVLHRFLCRTLIPILPAMLLRRSFLTEHGIHATAGCRFSEDMYVMWRIFAEAEEVVSIEVPLYYYLFHQNSTMTSSSAERILTGYQAFTALTADGSFAADFSERPFILPRWVLGALNSTARIAENYDSFFAVAEQMDYLRHMAALRQFPEGKARILSQLLRISPKLYYRLLHRRK